MTVPVLAPAGNGVRSGLSTTTDHCRAWPGWTVTAFVKAIAVTVVVVAPEPSVNVTSTGNGVTTAGTADVLRSPPDAVVRTIWGRVALICAGGCVGGGAPVGTEPSTCCSTFSTPTST